MGKSDVSLKFDAQTADFVQKILQMRQEMQKTGEAAQEVGKKTVSMGDEIGNYFKNLASGLGLAIPSAVEVSLSAITSLSDAAKKAMHEAEEGARQFIQRQRDIKQSLAAAGQVGQYPAVQAWIKQTAQATGATEDDLTKMFTGIGNELGAKGSVADKQAATMAGMDAKKTGLSTESAAHMGSAFARMKLAQREPGGGGFGGMNDDQIKDMAYQLEVYRPNMSDQDWRFFSRSKDKAQAARLLFAAGQSDENAKGLTKLQELANDDPARIQQYLDNPQSAPANVRLGLQNLKRGMADAPALSLQQQQAASRQPDQGNLILSGQKAAEKAQQKILEDNEEYNAKIETIRKLRRAEYDKKHPIMKNLSFHIKGIGWGNEDAAGYIPTDAEVDYEASHRNEVDPSNTTYGDRLRRQSNLDPDTQIKVLMNGLQEINGNLRDISGKIKTNPMLKNDNPGQK